jgi:hypothetical protein
LKAKTTRKVQIPKKSTTSSTTGAKIFHYTYQADSAHRTCTTERNQESSATSISSTCTLPAKTSQVNVTQQTNPDKSTQKIKSNSDNYNKSTTCKRHASVKKDKTQKPKKSHKTWTAPRFSARIKAQKKSQPKTTRLRTKVQETEKANTVQKVTGTTNIYQKIKNPKGDPALYLPP